LLRAAWDDAKSRLTDVSRLASLLERAVGTMLHVTLDRISPMAVPVLVMIGREAAPPGAAEDELLIEAESLAEMAMRLG
jgi:ATP-dependent Lhr-like helicase